MQIRDAGLLGIVQGLTEFLPISSTAHLVVVRTALGHPHTEDAFTTVIQLGTLAAVFAYFRSDILAILKALIGDLRTRRFAAAPASRLAWLIAFGSIPVVVIGFTLKKWLKSNFYDLPTMGLVAVIFASLMAAAELWRSIRGDRNAPETGEHDITWLQSLWIGAWQALALMPGASRSGATITGATFAGLSRPAAARFSFLLSLPSILGAGLKELYDEYKLVKNPALEDRPSLFDSTDDLVALAFGMVVSAVVGYAAIWGLMAFLRRYGLWVFMAYRLVFGMALLLWAR